MKQELKRRILILGIIFVFISGGFMSSEKVYALADGAYTVNTITSYTNPETGKIDDGGTANADLGESMSRNVIGQKALLEAENGKFYITIRLALASNCSNIRFSVEPSRGSHSYYETSNENTSSNNANDTRDYRFEVNDPNVIISPIMYVQPMGRDVKFYAYLDMSSAVSGKGDFVSKISVQNNETSDKTEDVINGQVSSGVDRTSQQKVETAVTVDNSDAQAGKVKDEEVNMQKNTSVSADELLDEAEGIEEFKNDNEEDEKSKNTKASTLAGVGIISVITLGIYGFYIKKIRN